MVYVPKKNGALRKIHHSTTQVLCLAALYFTWPTASLSPRREGGNAILYDDGLETKNNELK